MRRPKRVGLANSSSRRIGLGSPDTSANAGTSSSVTSRDLENDSPTLNFIVNRCRSRHAHHRRRRRSSELGPTKLTSGSSLLNDRRNYRLWYFRGALFGMSIVLAV